MLDPQESILDPLEQILLFSYLNYRISYSSTENRCLEKMSLFGTLLDPLEQTSLSYLILPSVSDRPSGSKPLSQK